MSNNTIKIKGQRYHLVVGAALIRDTPELDWSKVLIRPGEVIIPREGRPLEAIPVPLIVPHVKSLPAVLKYLEDGVVTAAGRLHEEAKKQRAHEKKLRNQKAHTAGGGHPLSD